jgi:outer membrane protein OmpA-like peptidoglycan-associated protein
MRSTSASRSGGRASNVLTLFVACALAAVAPLAASVVAPGHASAQSSGSSEFDDEFDDEFEDRQRTPAAGSSSGSARSGATADDLAAEDEFGGGDEAPASGAARTAPAASTPAPAEGRPTDARGDLLSANGSRAWRQRRFVLHNTWGGSVGGLHVVDAGSGPSQSFRVQLLTNFFFANGFLNPDDDNQHIGGAISLSYTPFDFLEIYASIQSYANSNVTESPGLFQVLGDSTIGLKGFYEVLPWLTIGGDFSLALLNTVGDIGLVLDSTSFNFRLNMAADFRALEGVEIPLIARLNAGYYLDRSAALTDGVERDRYDALPTVGPDARRSFEDEDRHLLTRVERFALNINRTDFFNIGLGVELPIHVMQDFYISPLVEWTVGIPVNSRSYSCLWIPAEPGGTTPAAGQDGCLEFQGFGAFPSNLSLGVRVQPAVRGLGIMLAVDIGTSGQTFVRELAGNAPYNVFLGLSYAVDTVPPPAEIVEREVERRVEVRIPPPVRGRLVATVVERGTTTGVGGAVVAFPGSELTSLSAGPDGRFTTYELAPGAVRMSISHPEYRDGDCSGEVPAEGGDVNVTCELEALPRLGIVRGRVVGDDGQPVTGATVAITGPQGFSVITDPSGGFARQGLPPGTYSARVESDSHLITTASFEIRPRATTEPTITVVARPRRAAVQLRARELVIRRQINFATDSAEILPDSIPLMTEIADALLRHPELTGIEIQGHTDNRGASARNQELSQQRADAVRQWLVGAGIAADRLTSAGYGDSRPIAPNITAGGRARNRRVQFMITSRAE